MSERDGRSQMVSLRLSEAEANELRTAAEVRGMSLSAFLRQSALASLGVSTTGGGPPSPAATSASLSDSSATVRMGSTVLVQGGTAIVRTNAEA
jgi:hypothetical protein